MKRSRLTEIIGILKEAEAGSKTAELARKHGVTEHCQGRPLGCRGSISPNSSGEPRIDARVGDRRCRVHSVWPGYVTYGRSAFAVCATR